MRVSDLFCEKMTGPYTMSSGHDKYMHMARK